MLLYERFLGRPFAAHRDSVSEAGRNLVESAIEDVLTRAGISFRKTGRAERLPGFDQAPDFVIPNEFNPQIVIEAKLTEDDGTARDKVTRVQHLASLGAEGRPSEQPAFEVVACIAGRGFGVRREDMRKLLLATRGKVFTLQNIRQLVEHTRLREFRTRSDHRPDPTDRQAEVLYPGEVPCSWLRRVDVSVGEDHGRYLWCAWRCSNGRIGPTHTGGVRMKEGNLFFERCYR